MKNQQRQVAFEVTAWEDYQSWVEQPKMLKRINRLITECLRTPFEGIGKPEALKGDLQGFWSRRIDEEHRLVYYVTDTRITIAQCKYHY